MQLCWTYDSYTDRAVLFGDSHGRAQECASEALLLDHGQLPQATYTKAKNELCSPLYMQVWNQLLIGDRISDMQVHIFLQADRYLHKRTPRNDTYWRAITQANWILLTQAHVKTDKVYIYMYVEGHKQRPSRSQANERANEQPKVIAQAENYTNRRARHFRFNLHGMPENSPPSAAPEISAFCSSALSVHPSFIPIIRFMARWKNPVAKNWHRNQCWLVSLPSSLFVEQTCFKIL